MFATYSYSIAFRDTGYPSLRSYSTELLHCVVEHGQALAQQFRFSCLKVSNRGGKASGIFFPPLYFLYGDMLQKVHQSPICEKVNKFTPDGEKTDSANGWWDEYTCGDGSCWDFCLKTFFPDGKTQLVDLVAAVFSSGISFVKSKFIHEEFLLLLQNVEAWVEFNFVMDLTSMSEFAPLRDASL